MHVIIIRGAGPSFCSGYDLSPEPDDPLPRPHRAARRLLESQPRRGLVRDDGHGHADHRPGARLLPRRRFGARGRVRPRLRRRGRHDRLPARAHDVVARLLVAAVAARLAPGDGGGAHRRLADRASKRSRAATRTARSRPINWRTRCCGSRNVSPRFPVTCSRSTSGPCIARWRRWVCVRVCAPERSCRRWVCTSGRRGSTCPSCGRSA